MKKLLWIIKSILYIVTTSIFLFRILSVNALAVENYQYFGSVNNARNYGTGDVLVTSSSCPVANYNTTTTLTNRCIFSSTTTFSTIRALKFSVPVGAPNVYLQPNKEYKLSIYLANNHATNYISSVDLYLGDTDTTTIVSSDKVDALTYITEVPSRQTSILREFQVDFYFTTGATIPTFISFVPRFNANLTFGSTGGTVSLYRTFNLTTVESSNATEVVDAINDQTGVITDSDTTDATNSIGNFFGGFTTDTYGLTSVISAPMVLISNLVSQTCTAIPMELIGYEFELPCIDSLIPSAFNPLLTLYRTVTDALIGYWIMINTLALIKDFKDPEKDNISVLEL